jgi:hypothetical protein
MTSTRAKGFLAGNHNSQIPTSKFPNVRVSGKADIKKISEALSIACSQRGVSCEMKKKQNNKDEKGRA